MPLTGYFTDRQGQKNFMLISIAGFVVTSALSGMATSLAQGVVPIFARRIRRLTGAEVSIDYAASLSG
jgi:MFS family permease